MNFCDVFPTRNLWQTKIHRFLSSQQHTWGMCVPLGCVNQDHIQPALLLRGAGIWPRRVNSHWMRGWVNMNNNVHFNNGPDLITFFDNRKHFSSWGNISVIKLVSSTELLLHHQNLALVVIRFFSLYYIQEYSDHSIRFMFLLLPTHHTTITLLWDTENNCSWCFLNISDYLTINNYNDIRFNNTFLNI